MKKIFYVVLDGLADRPIKELRHKTPLEAALTPNMDKLAQRGKSGIVYVAGKNRAVESDAAVLHLLGYEADKDYTGRGVLESFAQGLTIEPGNIAFRVNFATLEDDGKTIKDRRAGRDLTSQEAIMLAGELNTKITLSNATFEFKNTIGHRGVLVLRAMHTQLSAWITNTDPAYKREGMLGVAKEEFEPFLLDSKPMPGHENSLAAAATADLINEFTMKAHKVLLASGVNKNRCAHGKLAANALLCRDAGDHLPQLVSLQERYGLKFGFFVQMPTEKGLAALTGAFAVEVPSLSGHPDIDYAVWSKIAAGKLKDFDILYIQIKGPGEAGHDGDFKKKRACIEMIDKYFFKHLLPFLKEEDVVIAVTSDHATPCILKTNSSDPVPLIVAGRSINPDGTLSFSERAAQEGSLGQMSGHELMDFLVKLAKE
ncbi:MAG: 2,3-bisphosphoglycerate-independent phosphoglycerate mutase [Candidatus Omnitrophota bacterium]